MTTLFVILIVIAAVALGFIVLIQSYFTSLLILNINKNEIFNHLYKSSVKYTKKLSFQAF